MWKRILPVLLVLLLAFALRVYALDQIPPGLTHDEANHGREAVGILQGNLALFFPLNYGSEPLYSYTVAGFFAAAGRELLTLRLVNVLFGVLTVAITYAWAARVLTRPTALLAAALMAVSFWPLAASREALRAGMMPFFTVGAALSFWLILERDQVGGRKKRVWFAVLGLAVCVAASLYNYLAARVFWLLFPLFLTYLALFHRRLFWRSWAPTVVGLLLAGLATIPMFLYLRANPQAQTRLSMFDNTALDILQGQVAPLIGNVREALLAFIWPGFGDQFLAYNIPGRPVFGLISALFFLLGVITCLWRWRKPAYAFVLLWFMVGIIPSLVTGATAGTTRNVGAYAPTFILPAAGFVALVQLWHSRMPSVARRLAPGAALLWLLLVLANTATDYFVRWGQAPEVRAAYQHTLVEALDYLGQRPTEQVVISSVYPGLAHNPSIGLLMDSPEAERRWVDARSALVLPQGGPATLLALAATPLHPQFAAWSELEERIELRPNDLNPGFAVYSTALPPDWLPNGTPVEFGVDVPALRLLDARWLAPEVRPGDVAEIMLVWEVLDPVRVGPPVPPIDATDVVFFTHVLQPDGSILMQRDGLDAPSWNWQRGDYVVQIHQMSVPPEAAPGVYNAVVGVYDRLSGDRLPPWNAVEPSPASSVPVAPVQIVAPE